MKKKYIIILSQVFWHTLYLSCCTIWKDISIIPYFAKASDILDRSRWYWLMDAPNHMEPNEQLILMVVTAASFAEILFCAAWVFVYLRKNWKNSSIKAKITYLSMIILGFTVSILFGLQMYSNFIKMSSYYYLWQQAFPVEIFAVIMFLFWAFHFFSLRKLHEKS